MVKKSDKRLRLIEAARIYFHQQGFYQTTLADIAEKANVPLGNIYYYFKTKEAIAEAAIDALAEKCVELFDGLKTQTPQNRLFSFLKLNSKELELILNYGCPIGTLCQELSKTRGVIAKKASSVLQQFLDWCAAQFKALGFEDRASDLAIHFTSSLQGIYLLAHTFNNSTLITQQLEVLQHWLSSLTQEISAANPKEVHNMQKLAYS